MHCSLSVAFWLIKGKTATVVCKFKLGAKVRFGQNSEVERLKTQKSNGRHGVINFLCRLQTKELKVNVTDKASQNTDKKCLKTNELDGNV